MVAAKDKPWAVKKEPSWAVSKAAKKAVAMAVERGGKSVATMAAEKVELWVAMTDLLSDNQKDGLMAVWKVAK